MSESEVSCVVATELFVKKNYYHVDDKTRVNHQSMHCSASYAWYR